MPTTSSPLAELSLAFLRIGATAFGGPAAHLAMMERELVQRREWLTRQELLDLIGVANLIPGPNSTEVAIHIGHRRAGMAGLVVAGVSFILPSFVMVLALAMLYARVGHVARVAAILAGIAPAVIGVIAQALWIFGRSALKSVPLVLLALLSLAAAALGAPQLLVLLGAGVIAVVTTMRTRASLVLAPWHAMLLVPDASPMTALFLVFLKVGAVLYGSGYVLFALLHEDLVARLHWLTETQLLDAIAAGQITPGPVFSTATFIGYVIGGGSGAVVATLGIFLPAFVYVTLSSRWIPRIRASAIACAFLDGVNVAALALLALVLWQLGRTAIVSPLTATLAIVSTALLLATRVNSAWVMLGGALIGGLVLR